VFQGRLLQAQQQLATPNHQQWKGALWWMTARVLLNGASYRISVIIITTSGRNNLTKGRIAAAHVRFNSIHQVAPMCTPFNTCFLGPTQFHNPNGISIGSAVFAGLATVTDQQTDRPHYSICNNRLHLHM